mmetsp:Transcript_27613/g.33726  ORF Transcript_27613/g.33726 Transcript_27613/m.33726 type:complete len:236 (-) Transcript_27613:568-1275(-)
MVPVCFLHGLSKLSPNHSILLGNGPEALRHAAFHALQATHVNMGLLILHQIPQFIRILCHLGLDVHLLSLSILLLTAHCIVISEVVRELLLVFLVLIIIQQRLGIWNAHKQPSQAFELSRRRFSQKTAKFGFQTRLCTSFVIEEQAQVGAHRRNPSACSEHDDVCLWVFREQHLGSGRTRDKNLIAWAHVTNVVGANTSVNLVFREAGSGLVWFVLTYLAIGIAAIHLNHSFHAQ